MKKDLVFFFLLKRATKTVEHRSPSPAKREGFERSAVLGSTFAEDG